MMKIPKGFPKPKMGNMSASKPPKKVAASTSKKPKK